MMDISNLQISLSGKCPLTKIKVVLNPTNMNTHPCMMLHSGQNCNQRSPYSDAMAWLYIGFTTAEIELSNRVLRIDLNMFVNAIGGGLGLFMGFSLINLMFMVYDGVLTVTGQNYMKARKIQQNTVLHI